MNLSFTHHQSTPHRGSWMKPLLAFICLGSFISVISFSYVLILDKAQRKSFGLIAELEKKIHSQIEFDSYEYGTNAIIFRNFKITGSTKIIIEQVLLRYQINPLYWFNQKSFLKFSSFQFENAQIDFQQQNGKSLFKGTFNLHLMNQSHQNDDDKTNHHDVFANAKLDFKNLAIDHPNISDSPVQITGSLSTDLSLNIENKSLNLNNSEVFLENIKNPLVFDLNTTFKQSGHTSIRFNTAKASCSEWFENFPLSLKSKLIDFKVEGEIGFGGYLQFEHQNLSNFKYSFQNQDFTCRTVSVPYRYSKERLTREFLYHNIYRNPDEEFAMGSNIASKDYVPLSFLPQHLILAITEQEDQNFFNHKGFDWNTLESALRRNLAEGKYGYGASTITMQVVKNLFLDRNKNIARKLQEAFLSWHLENNLPKERILEIYVNMVEFGPNIWGINQASAFYFKKSASDLNPKEAKILVKALPNPLEFFSKKAQKISAQKIRAPTL